MKKIAEIFKSKRFPIILLVLMIVIQLTRTGFVIAFEKEGYHSDEIFCYGLSNSFFNPFIDSDNYAQSDEYKKNINQWIDGSVLRNYITVQEGEQFRYDSVWYNQEMDRHPPLHYSLIHTFSSFFPDRFIPEIGYAINFICFIFLQIYLYKLSKILLKSEYLAVLVCTCWGFCTACLNMLVFIRMYCMLAMLTVIFLYLNARLAVWVLENPREKFGFKDSKNIPASIALGLTIVTFLGGLTQYIYFICAFICTVLFCFWLLFQKNVRVFLQYGISVLTGVILSVAVFPASINQIFGETNENKVNSYTFGIQIKKSINYFLWECFGININYNFVDFVYTLIGIIILLVIFGAAVFLFREKIKPMKKLKKFKAWIFGQGKKLRTVKMKMVIRKLRSFSPITFIIAVVFVSIIAITSLTVDFYTLVFIDRYFFSVYPIAFLMMISILYFIFLKLSKKKVITMVLIFLLTINVIINAQCTYLFKNSGNLEDISDIVSGNSFVVVEENRGSDWLVTTMTVPLYNVNNIFMTNVDDIGEHIEDLNSLEDGGDIYVMFSNILFFENNKMDTIDYDKIKEYVSYYESSDIINKLEYVGTYEIYTRVYQIYKSV